jgi:regulatory protein
MNEVLDKLEALCAKREYCVSDIRRKAIERLDGDRQAAEELVQSLIGNKFVDDARYASAFAREKSGLQGWGPIKIRFQLRAKGISDSIITEALSEIDGTKARTRLEKLLENKWRSLSDDPQGRLKLIKFALSRGYEYEDTEPLIKRITSA